ncbi:hypothetical protein [Neobacillus citreus]|uniref:Uncharacterized protein n=1 Tax=Neobacillus citreus TaxID=2833578 RepID=A0A9J6MYX2_9BACI|nr:hypothetical protein [Neobacillus citreus]MCH6268906.1 hypothetical protein [Neobacillus citreus]
MNHVMNIMPSHTIVDINHHITDPSDPRIQHGFGHGGFHHGGYGHYGGFGAPFLTGLAAGALLSPYGYGYGYPYYGYPSGYYY